MAGRRQVLPPGSRPTKRITSTTRGLVGWWPLTSNTISGTTARDYSPTAANGTLVGSPVINQGKPGRTALNFDATNTYVTVGTPSALNLTGDFSVSIWASCRSTPASGSYRYLASHGYDGARDQFEFGIQNNSHSGNVNGLYFGFFNGSDHGPVWTLPASFTLNRWYHFVGTRLGSVYSIYADGVLVATATDATASVTPTQATVIGAMSLSGAVSRKWDGLLEDARIYNRALSPPEINQLFLNPTADYIIPNDNRGRAPVPFTGITGTLNATLDNITSSSTGTVLVQGAGVSNFGNLTTGATGTVLVTGSGAITFPAITSASAGTVLVTGTLGATISALTLSSTGTVGSTTITGTVSATLDNLTSSSTGTVLVTGSEAITFPAITSASTGTVRVTGSEAITFPAITSASAGTVLVTGTLSSTIAAITSASAGTVLVTGSEAITFPAITSASTGTVLVTGTLGATIAALTLSSTGTVVTPGAGTITGTLAKTIPAITITSAGKVLVKGALTKTIGNLTLASHIINPALLPPNRAYIQIPQYNIDNPPPGAAETLAHVVLKLREMQHWFDMLSEAAVQPTQFAPLNPKYGMMRYAIGQWAGTLGAVGLYIYKEGGWTHVA